MSQDAQRMTVGRREVFRRIGAGSAAPAAAALARRTARAWRAARLRNGPQMTEHVEKAREAARS